MGKQRGIDFIAGLIIGAAVATLVFQFLPSHIKKNTATSLKPSVQSLQNTPASFVEPTRPPQTNGTKNMATNTAQKNRLPLLPPPNFAATLPHVLYSDPKGQVFLQWLPVNNARRYQVLITNDKDHRVKLVGYVHTSVYLTDLPPPALTESERVYWVRIATQNTDQMAGEYGEKRKIIYLGKVLSTPKIQSIHVEE